MRTTWTPALALVVLAACSPPAPPTVNPDPVRLGGTYQVVSAMEVPAVAAVPGMPGDALRLVGDLAENPAGALLDLAEGADVPALGTLRLLVPDTLEAQLEAWMNASLETASVGGVAPVDELAELNALIESVLLRWQLRSELDLGDPLAGTHAPTAIAFDVVDRPVVVMVDVTAPVTAATGVEAALSWPQGPDGPARVTVGDHAMGVPFGHYALEALRTILDSRYGAPTIRAAVGQIVDCRAVAESVAARCIGFVCVGHADELEEVCSGGLDAAASQLEEKILAIDYRAIRLRSGVAIASGVALDPEGSLATVDALAAGVWTATVDLGQGEEDASATFTAVR
jgi:hypothetical protein